MNKDKYKISSEGSNISMNGLSICICKLICRPNNNDAMLRSNILLILIGLIISAAAALANGQEQEEELQQQTMPQVKMENFTLNIDVLGINSKTRNSTISITGSGAEPLASNITVDLFAEARQDYPSESNPLVLSVPININSSLIHEGDELKACLRMTDTGETDCELTIITRYNIEGFPKSIPLDAGRNIEQQITDLPK